MTFGVMASESSRRSRSVSMETGGLPLVSTFALLTIVAGQLQGSGYSEQEPEFLSPLENLTVAQGRDVHFTCTVNHLGTYKRARTRRRRAAYWLALAPASLLMVALRRVQRAICRIPRAFAAISGGGACDDVEAHGTFTSGAGSGFTLTRGGYS
ncbi:unnamed protein product [Spodoptera exigua]|nr:unnamed protein product [Spodoptera exigua]